MDMTLRRVVSLPLLVFYGLGVTIGAGIFALIGEITSIAGDHAPWAFVMAGAIAGVTGLSYAKLSAHFPRAAGEAIFVKTAMGKIPGLLAGLGVALSGITSSAVIVRAFAGYLSTLLPIPDAFSIMAVIALLGVVTWWGVRESVGLAAIITLLELGALAAVIAGGLPQILESDISARLFDPPGDQAASEAIFSAGIIAFFAFIGFENIVNMGEEAIDAPKTLPLAIFYTLVISILIYFAVALVAISFPEREALIASDAPLAFLFERTTHYPGTIIASIASFAIVNGVLIQIIMASRVLFGMAEEKLLPPFLKTLDAKRRTPGLAILLVCLAITGLALFLPLLELAHATSLITLAIFIFVNFALWRIGNHPDASPHLKNWRYWGLFGAGLTASLLLIEIIRLI